MTRRSATSAPCARLCRLTVALVAALAASAALAYPTDQYEQTGIRRLKWQHEVDFEGRRGTKNVPGGQWPAERIRLRLLEQGHDFELTVDTPKDPELQAGVEDILKRWRWSRYNIALLDITDPSKPRYAGVNETALQTPGSTAKVLVGAGLLDQLRRRFPDDIETRKAMLRGVLVSADEWVHPNHHEVPVVSGENLERVSIRRVLTGDTFSLWEWMDHALSPSSNAAASMTWREAMLMSLLGEDYPPEKYDQALFLRWDKETMTEAAYSVVDSPLIDAGLDVESFRLRLFFTKNPSRYVRGSTCRVSPLALVQWMVRVEQGRMVDPWSSLELKKMLYLTRRRVRYVYTPVLRPSAVWFKSGSLYGCAPEPGFRCGKYRGNRINVLNSLVAVETPREPPEPAETDAEPRTSAPGADITARSPNPASAATDGPPQNEGRHEAPQGEAATGALLATEDAEAARSTSAATAAQPICVAPAPPPAPPPHVYIIAVMSNELKRSAASDHANLAAEIHKLITKE